MTADRARGALAVLQDADGKFICEVPCGYIVEQTASAHKPRRIQAQRRRRAMLRRRVALTVALLTVAALLAALMPWSGIGGRDRLDRDTPPRLLRIAGRNEKPMGICTLKGAAHMKDNKSGWQFPKALEIIKCKEGNKEFMKERPARRPFGNTVLICEYPIDDTAAEEPNAKLITWRLAKRAARDFLRVSFMPSAIVSAATHGGKTAVRVYGKY